MAKSIVYSKKAPEPIGPYSQAVRVGNLLFVSGQIAISPDSGELVKSGVGDEAHRVMKNLGAVLEAGGMNFSHVVKTSIFLKSMKDFATVNEIYGTFFSSDPPARETVEVSALPKGVSVEISCIATRE